MESLEQTVLIPEAYNPLIARLLLKQDLLRDGDNSHEAIKTALIIGGGGMRGVFSGGVVTGLEEAGLQDVFDDVIGISAGAASAAYLLAGNPRMGTSIYYEDLPNKDFINPARLGNIMDLAYLERIFRYTKPLDQEAIRGSRSNLHIGVTQAASGRGEYIDVTKAPELDIIRALIASSSIPGFTEQAVDIEGIAYSDGVTGCTNPIKHAISAFGSTDILVVANRPLLQSSSLPLYERTMAQLSLRRFSKSFRQAHMLRHVSNDFRADRVNEPGINIGVICPENMPVSQFSKNSGALARIAFGAVEQTKHIFI